MKQWIWINIQNSFKRICQDYMEIINPMNINTLAADFCKKALFKLGSEWDKVSSDGPDWYWVYTFEFYDPHLHFVTNKKLYVGTFKYRFAKYIPRVTDCEMVISVQDACLLALDTYCKLLDVNEKLPMTPSMMFLIKPESLTLLVFIMSLKRKFSKNWLAVFILTDTANLKAMVLLQYSGLLLQLFI